MTISPAPETLAAALDALDALVPTATKQYLHALDEAGLRREFWGLGIAVRNVLGLWREDSRLAGWFQVRGIVRPDEMSDEILCAYWRRLHGLEPNGSPGGFASVQGASGD